LFPTRSTKEKVSFHLINGATGNRLKQQYIDGETEEIVDRDEQVKGYEVAKGEYVTVTEEELAGVEVESSHTIDIESFVARIAARFDRKPVDSRLLFRSYKPVVTPSVAGLRVNPGPTVAAVSDEVVYGTRAPIAVSAKPLAPKVTEKSIGPVIVIRRGSNRLTLYNGQRPVRQFAVATGQTIYPTPLGRFQIVVKWKNPWWYPPADPWAKGEKPTPPGPGNPLGTRWMGISSPGVGIHGTPEDGSIGYSLSHGCIRMHIPQAEWLFNHVDVGTPVYIVAS